MIRTLQKKFIITAMIAVSVLLLVLLGGINGMNAVSANGESEELLTMLASFEGFGPAPRPDGLREPGGLFRREMDENDRMAALTFTVRFDSEDQVESMNLERISSVSEEEAETLARTALASGRETGRLQSYRFKIVEPAEGYHSVVFLDISQTVHALLRVAALSALLGLLTWLAMLALVTLLSRRAIRPIAENIERQRQFVTDAGHELKTPLAIILANLDAMELCGGESKYSRNIRAQAQRLSTLMQNLLTLARLDENSAPADLAPLDLAQLTREAAEMFRAPAELRHLGYVVELPETLPFNGSKTLLQQLLSTLLDNAVKYCEDGGTISVRLRQEDRAVLRIENTVGTEHPPLERLFDRFYRADGSRNQKNGGFGIGLSAAQTIVRLHKGEISAHYEGDTIVFTVKL